MLSGCREAAVLPTRAVLMSLPTSVPTAALAGNHSYLPLTYTPIAPTVPMDIDGNATALPRLAASVTPSPVPIFPTITPILPTPTQTLTPTIMPSPMPTRYINAMSVLPPTNDLGPSKLGIHVVRNNDPGIMEFVRHSQPAVVKAVDDVGFLEEVKAASPRTIVIGRLSARTQDYVGEPEEAAREFVAQQLTQYLANPFVDYWEGWNEPDPNMTNMAWYARFEQERARVMASYGLKVAVGSFPAGVPEMDEFMLFLPAIETAIEHRGILSLHEGSAPTIDFLYGEPLPGYLAYPDRGAMAFRYRWYYREILEPAGLIIPLVISELGIDGVIGNRPGPSGLGWRDFSDYWEEEGIWGDSGVEAFVNQMAWYDKGVREDGYVIGFTIFTAGAIGQWEPYNINGILPELTDYVISQQ